MTVEASPNGPEGPIARYDPLNGKFYIRLEPLESLNKYETLAFVLHEGVPGHHLYSVVTKNTKHLPDFIKFPMYDRLVSCISSILYLPVNV